MKSPFMTAETNLKLCLSFISELYDQFTVIFDSLSFQIIRIWWLLFGCQVIPSLFNNPAFSSVFWLILVTSPSRQFQLNSFIFSPFFFFFLKSKFTFCSCNGWIDLFYRSHLGLIPSVLQSCILLFIKSS